MAKQRMMIAGYLSIPVLFARTVGLITVAEEPLTAGNHYLSVAYIVSAFLLGALAGPLFATESDSDPANRRKINKDLAMGGAVYGFLYSLIAITILMASSDREARGILFGWGAFWAPAFITACTIFFSLWPFLSWEWKRFWRPPK